MTPHSVGRCQPKADRGDGRRQRRRAILTATPSSPRCIVRWTRFGGDAGRQSNQNALGWSKIWGSPKSPIGFLGKRKHNGAMSFSARKTISVVCADEVAVNFSAFTFVVRVNCVLFPLFVMSGKYYPTEKFTLLLGCLSSARVRTECFKGKFCKSVRYTRHFPCVRYGLLYPSPFR